MGLLRLKLAVAALCSVGALLVTHSAEAIGEQYYMALNCHLEDPAGSTGWGLNQWGYYNTSTSQFLTLYCQQPHLLGNDGHNGGFANVWDRAPGFAVTISLCGISGFGEVLDCETLSSVGAGSLNRETLNFAPRTNPSVSYYFWKAVIPPFDPTLGSSHLSALFFKDN